MSSVQVLMSTYNGEKYLEQQIDSILEQTYPDVRLLIRDDGSTDGTLDILDRYAKKYENMSYYSGTNIGVIKSFFELMRNSDDTAQYYALADQDDKWLPNKIEKAIGLLEQEQSDLPLLYCSDTFITDSSLNAIKQDNKYPKPSWGNALVQNICTGCTAVMNRGLRNIVITTKPEHIVMHDWWLYITAELFGRVCYDDNAYILYRQHGNNEHGAKKNCKEVWKYRLEQLRKPRGEIYRQLEEVKQWYPQMDEDKRTELEKVLKAEKGLKNKMRLIMNKKIYRNKKMDDIVFRGIVLIGKL